MMRALAAIVAFAGFDRPTPTPFPRRRRTSAPAAVAVASDTTKRVSDMGTSARRRAVLTKPNTVAEALVCVDTVHGGSHAFRSYTGGPPAVLDRKARAVLGDELHSYCRSLILTGSKIPVVPRPVEADEAFNKRLNANLVSDMLSDIDTWERGMDAVARMSKATSRAGLPSPDPLTIPDAVLVAIAARQTERAKRLARGAGGRTGKGGPPVAAQEGTLAELKAADNDGESASLKGGGGRKRKRDDEEDAGGFVPPTPAGPRR